MIGETDGSLRRELIITDESFVFRTEVNERANIARNSKNRAMKGGKCILPSDSMSHWAKKRKNGDVVLMAPNRPILYDDFKELSEDSQRKYLQGLIDNHGGTTERIAKMWGVSEAKVKNYRQLLGIKSYFLDPSRDYEDIKIDAKKWESFLAEGNFMKEPMQYDAFKMLSTNEKKEYLHFLIEDLDASPKEIADLFGCVDSNVRTIFKKLGIQTKPLGTRYTHTKWNEWLQKYDAHCGVHQIDENHYEYSNAEPTIPENHINITETDATEPISIEQKPVKIRESDIPYLNLIMTVKDYEQIFDILKTLPRAQSGTITFTFGEESEKIGT